MLYLNGLVGIFLAVAAFLLFDLQPILASVFAISALLALSACRGHVPKWQAIVLGSMSALAMLVFFTYFLVVTPFLDAQWYFEERSRALVAALIGGFAMMLVLAEYSSFMKGKVESASRPRFSERYQNTMKRVRKFRAT